MAAIHKPPSLTLIKNEAFSFNDSLDLFTFERKKFCPVVIQY